MSDKPFPHGTVAGYLRHKRAKEKACPECRRAWNAYYRKPHKT